MLYISNFVLDLLNLLKIKDMKRAVLVFLISALVLASTGIWIFSSKGNFNSFDFVTFGIIFHFKGAGNE